MDFNFATILLNLFVSIAVLIGVVMLMRKGQPAPATVEAPKRSASSTRYRVI